MGPDDRNLLIGLLVALGVALGADIMASKVSRRARRLAALVTLAAAGAYGTVDWLRERPQAYSTNPTLSPAADWLGHTMFPALIFAMPILVGLGVAAVLRRTRVARPFRVLVTGTMVFGSLFVAIVLMFMLGAILYNDGP